MHRALRKKCARFDEEFGKNRALVRFEVSDVEWMMDVVDVKAESTPFETAFAKNPWLTEKNVMQMYDYVLEWIDGYEATVFFSTEETCFLAMEIFLGYAAVETLDILNVRNLGFKLECEDRVYKMSDVGAACARDYLEVVLRVCLELASKHLNVMYVEQSKKADPIPVKEARAKLQLHILNCLDWKLGSTTMFGLVVPILDLLLQSVHMCKMAKQPEAVAESLRKRTNASAFLLMREPAFLHLKDRVVAMACAAERALKLVLESSRDTSALGRVDAVHALGLLHRKDFYGVGHKRQRGEVWRDMDRVTKALKASFARPLDQDPVPWKSILESPDSVAETLA